MRHSGLRFHKPYIIFGLTMVALVVYLSLTGSPPIELTFAFADKFEHLTAYALLMGWFSQLYWGFRQRILLATAFVLMGVSMEILQGLGGVRYFDYYDMLANSSGVFIAWLLVSIGLQQILQQFERLVFGIKVDHASADSR